MTPPLTPQDAWRARVLQVLTGVDPPWWAWLRHPSLIRDYDSRGVVSSFRREPGGSYDSLPWIHDSPSEAWEALVTAGLLPASAADDPRRRYWRSPGTYALGEDVCSGCSGGDGWLRHGNGGSYGICRECPYVTTPATWEALVALTSREWAEVERAENLASELVRTQGMELVRVVWRVLSRTALKNHYDPSRNRPFRSLVDLFALEQSYWLYSGEYIPWEKDPELYTQEDVQLFNLTEAWPLLRALAVSSEQVEGEDVSTGTHLLELQYTPLRELPQIAPPREPPRSQAQVVLGVERVPGELMPPP